MLTIDPVQVVAHEREGRDRGWWNQMADCYHPDSHVHSMWFSGTGMQFVDASRQMAANGDRSRHRLSVPSVHLHGERAVVTMPMAIEFRVELHGVQADLTAYARGIYRLERRDGLYRICDLSTIYERDTLTPALPGVSIPVDQARLFTLPSSYRMMAYYFTVRGYDVDTTMPSDDEPDSAERLLTEAMNWLVDPRKEAQQ